MSAPAAETEALTSTQPVDPSGPSRGTSNITGKSPMQIALGRLVRDKIAMVCLVVATLFVLIAIFATPLMKLFGVTTETQYASQVLDLITGLPKAGPPLHGYDPEHPFGVAPRTGVDNLAVWLKGCQISLMIAGSATLLASVFGIVMGLLAGFLGGIVDRVITFLTDFFLTIPFLLAALSIAPIINERFNSSPHYDTYKTVALIGVLSVFGWMSVARLIRGEVLSLREREFIHAARVVGMPTRRILVKELLPNLAAPIVVAVSLMLPSFVALEAGLAFLGIGVPGSWGTTINTAVPYWDNYPLYMFEPLLGVVLLVLSLNLLGDAIRDAMDPKTRR